ncbi:hypothetical protein DIPPA_01464 [Diplonema papillatum]|nr:hypothetical protein DIPPA_01464 [Diplonema papillatum]
MQARLSLDLQFEDLTSEVKFLDRRKTNFCESIRQECLH